MIPVPENSVIPEGANIPVDNSKANGEFPLQVIVNTRPRAVKNLTRLLACSVLFAVIANLAIIIAIMVLQFNNNHVTLGVSSSALEYIAQNLNSNPIIDIALENFGAGCSSGYSPIMIKLWPGTDEGCACSLKHFHKSFCRGFEGSCRYVFSISPIPVYKWWTSSWCAKRIQLGTDYLKLATCPQGFRQCSAGICVSNYLNCPLTSVAITSTPVFGNSQKYGPSQYLTTYRVSGDAPLINIDVTENGIPCFSPDRTAKGPTKSYKLLNSRPKGCGRYGFDSSNSFWIDQKTEFDLLNNNNFPLEVFQLPWYPDNLKSTLSYLSGRTRIRVNNKDFCQSMDHNVVNDLTKTLKKLNVAINATSITAIAIHSILILLLSLIICCITCNHSYRGALRGRKSGAWVWTFLVFEFVEIVLYIIMVALIGVCHTKLSQHRDYFGQFIKENCFIELPSSLVIHDINMIIGDVTLRFLGLSIALLVIALSSFVFTIWLRSYRRMIKL